MNHSAQVWHMAVSRRGKQCGAVLLEAAITSIVLFFFLFAILQFGRAYNIYQTITDAAREGARYSVAPDPNNAYVVPSASQIQNRVQGFMATANVQGSTVKVFCVYAGGTPAPDVANCPAGSTQASDPTLQADNGLNPSTQKCR
jgi:Flp pilus assembly protein TadG